MSIFSDSLAAGADAVFANSGEAVIYTAAGKAPVSATGLVVIDEEIGEETHEDGRRRIRTGTVTVRDSEIAAPAKGDKLHVRGADWIVYESTPIATVAHQLAIRREERLDATANRVRGERR